MIRLNDRLKVTEEQKTEITNMLFAYIKKISLERDVTHLSPLTITTWWLQQVEKPRWLQEKIVEDAEFIGQVCAFVETYKDTVHRQGVEEYPLSIREAREAATQKFLADLRITKGVMDQGVEETEADALRQIDRLFYPNNESNTLGEFPI